MAVFQSSRYVNTSAYIKNGENLMLANREKAIFNSDNFTYYTVLEGDTIDCIAYKVYGDAQLYWAILDANPTFLSELDITEGSVIAIPDIEEVVRISG